MKDRTKQVIEQPMIKKEPQIKYDEKVVLLHTTYIGLRTKTFLA